MDVKLHRMTVSDKISIAKIYVRTDQRSQHIEITYMFKLHNWHVSVYNLSTRDTYTLGQAANTSIELSVDIGDSISCFNIAYTY